MGKWICNPLDLEYRYQYRTSLMGGYSLAREAADPTLLLFRDRYYLFASMSGGFWHSEDLAEWHFRETPELPAYDYAPDVREAGGRVVFSASRRGEPCTFYVSSDPLTEPFTPVSTIFDFWDPDIFEDEDGRIYFYWGCTNKEPIWGIEMDPVTLLSVGEKQAMFGENEAHHGWERKGDNNKLSEPVTEMDRLIRQHVGTKPFIEGAFMTKHRGKYYLQYAAPGTECNVYADGVYVSDRPLGPFVYQAHNPFSSKPGGFITAAGHGSTIRDRYGNWWHASTMRISVNESFERRIGLFPCGFDEDGMLYCNQNFADYPYVMPKGQRTEEEDALPQMCLLSCRCKASASSAQEGFGPEKGVDESIRTWWAAREDDAAPWYEIDLGAVRQVRAIQINLADHKMPPQNISQSEMVGNQTGARHIFVQPQITGYLLEGSADGREWMTLLDAGKERSDRPHRLLVPDEPADLRYLRLSGFAIPFGGVPAVSGLRVFGPAQGEAPESVKRVKAVRSEDGLNILLQWSTAAGAQGYNVRYGIAPEKLYNSWQVINGTELDLSMVNAGQTYYIAVDSYGPGGVAAGEIMRVEG